MALGNLSGQVGTLRDPDGHFTSCRGAYVIVAYATVTDRLDSYEILTDILATRANPRRQWRTFISLVRATKQRIARSAGILPPASCNVWRRAYISTPAQQRAKRSEERRVGEE